MSADDDVPPLPEEEREWLDARVTGLVSRRFKESVDAYVTLRAAGMDELKAYVTAGLPMVDGKPKRGVLKMLAGRKDIASRIAKKAVRNVNIAEGTEDSLRTLHRFASLEEIPVVCKECGGKFSIAVPPDTQIKAAAEFLKVAARSDILTLRERAALEENPETRADLARMVLADMRGANEVPVIDAGEPIVEVEPE